MEIVKYYEFPCLEPDSRADAMGLEASYKRGWHSMILNDVVSYRSYTMHTDKEDIDGTMIRTKNGTESFLIIKYKEFRRLFKATFTNTGHFSVKDMTTLADAEEHERNLKLIAQTTQA